MITEFIIVSPLIFLWWKFNLSIWIVLGVVFTLYWLPKWLIKIAEVLFPNVIFRNKNKYISLTFDDIPYDNETYNSIIRILDSFNMKATFFVISGQITSESKEALVAAVKNGHHLGNHGHSNYMHALLNQNDLLSEITSCHNLIKEIYNMANVKLPDTLFYRPGCGVFTNQVLKVMKECDKRYELALGSVYPNDPVIRSLYLNYFYLVNHIEPGDIIILHDRRWTPDLLYNLLSWISKNKFSVSTLQ
jgi:peptidoglycan-N-acetylglucosamine deacetylase